MLTLNENRIISNIVNNFMNQKPEAVNLFDYVVSFISSGKTDYIQRKVLIDILNKNIRNQKIFFFHVASHYYLTTNNGENQIEKLNEDNIIDDYYRQINEIIQSVRANSLLGRKRNKIEELIQKYIPEIFSKN